MAAGRVNYLTVDFEDWYQGLTSTSSDVGRWPELASRLDIGAHWLLDCLAETGTRATFFIVGRVAEEHPHLVRRIAEAGHEIGLHGHLHRLVSSMDADEFRDDVRANKQAVERAAGTEATCFRAPCFSFPEGTDWFYTTLAEAGVRIDSSVFPIRNPLYGAPRHLREPYRVETEHGTVQEIPVTTLRAGPVNLPFSGGFYFRMLPYSAVRWAFERENAAGRGVVFYCHPWELDPDHPQPAGVTPRERLSHYAGLRGARDKLQRLLRDFRFEPLGRMAD